MQKSGKTAVIVSLLIVTLLVMAFVFAGPTPRAAKACRDGADNDGDGYTDWPADPGCQNKNDDSELNPAIECDDGSDNDGDSATDMNDTGCSSPTDTDETDCGDAVCEGGETSGTCPEDCGTPDSCSDSDGGVNYVTFGTTSGYLNNNYYEHDDYCIDSSNIEEFYCSGDYNMSLQASCGTDGYGNYTCSGGDVYREYFDRFCASGACDENMTLEFVEECDYGCTNGECDPIPDSCMDSDGINQYTFGNVSGHYNEQWYFYEDYCVDLSYAMEYWCSGDYSINQSLECYDIYDYFCDGDDVYNNVTDYFCSGGNCNNYNFSTQFVETCAGGCFNGTCV